ncbi:MAG: sugar O-acetyltransferase [Sphaerochaetaceae bacterium]|nr:sugar O-acetyltransferase [Sphaerochaetaceae bacterium]
MKKEDIIYRMQNKMLYFESDAFLEGKVKKLETLKDFNNTRPSEDGRRFQLLYELFKRLGENCVIEPPLHANWGGANVSIGDNFYANFNLTLVDDAEIKIGNNVMIGPNVTIATACHPISPALREKGCQYNLPVTIEDNVWIGAGVSVLPGVTIHKNSIIGAGSIVTKDVPENVIAFGNPCKVSRKINERDDKFYNRDMEIDLPLD